MTLIVNRYFFLVRAMATGLRGQSRGDATSRVLLHSVAYADYYTVWGFCTIFFIAPKIDLVSKKNVVLNLY